MQNQIFPFQNSPLAKFAFAAITLEKLYRKFKNLFSGPSAEDENAEESEIDQDGATKDEETESFRNRQSSSSSSNDPSVDEMNNMFFSIDKLYDIIHPQKKVLGHEVVRIGLLVLISFLFYRYFL